MGVEAARAAAEEVARQVGLMSAAEPEAWGDDDDWGADDGWGDAGSSASPGLASGSGGVTAAANDAEGEEVSQRRKFTAVLSGSKVSQICSSVGIQLGARWQFCSSTQLPCTTASSIIDVAIGPWP